MPKSPDQLIPIFSSPVDMNESTDQAMLDGIKRQFPIETGKYRLDVKDLYVDKKDFSHKHEKEAILKSGSLTYPVKGTLLLYDIATGELVDKIERFSLADTFHITNKHTLIYKGNNYSVANLIQLRPGVYTRRKNTGEPENHFNTGVGVGYSIAMDPTTYIITFSKIGDKSVKLPVAPVLTEVFGYTDAQITQFIRKEIWEANKAVLPQKDRIIRDLYRRMMNQRDMNPNASYEERIEALRRRIQEGSLNEDTTGITLGKSFSHVNGEVFLRAISNLVALYRRERPEDNRDSLQFKRVQNLPDFIARRFDENKAHQTVTRSFDRIKYNLSRLDDAAPDLRKVLPSKPFNRVFEDFIIKSQLASTPDETNPIESLENVGKVTIIGQGEGGIKDDQSAPMESRNVHPSHLGIIDPSRTPESRMAGLDQRFTITARRDKEGTMYSRALDAKTGKEVYLSTHELMIHVVGFPGEKDNGKPVVTAQVNGEFRKVPREQVQYWIPSGTDMYTITTNLVPFLNSNHPGRLTMAGKALPQALSLVGREAPLVQTVDPNSGHSYVHHIGKIISTLAPTDGTITKATDEEIHIKGTDGKNHVVDFVKNLPFNMKGFHDDEPYQHKVGDKVTAGQTLADNNYTKDGVLAIGKNLHVAYMPYKGFNHEDGIVASRSATKSLRSHHAYKFDYTITKITKTNKALLSKQTSKFTPSQLAKLDERGFPKKGTKLEYGDPVFAVLEERQATETDKVLGRLYKTLTNPYKVVSEVWDHEEPGEVVDVYTDSENVRILVRCERDLEVGDKITGLHGNKGVISHIMEDHEMPHSRDTGKPVDLVLNPASVTSRINLGQVLETAAAKIAKKTGEPYKTVVYENQNNIVKVMDDLKKHNLSDTEEIYDPVSGKTIGDKVLAGPQYIIKLNKTTDANYSARSVGGYDNNAQPTKGGDDGAKAVSYMEFLGLLGSDARKNLKEIGTVKSEGGINSDTHDYWERLMKGMPLPQPKTTFATKKFLDYLRGSGIKVSHKEGFLQAGPMTDNDVLNLSKGQVTNTISMKARTQKGEPGSIFDQTITGGFEGSKWSHYTLAEPIVNPNLENPLKTILNINQKEFDNITSGRYGVVRREKGLYDIVDTHDNDKVLRQVGIIGGITKKAEKYDEYVEPQVGGEAFKQMLQDIDPAEEIEALKEAIKKSTSVSKRNDAIKRLKFLHGLHSQGHKELDKAMVLHHVPVIPPKMRPISITNQNIEYGDVNKLYQHHMLVSNRINKIYEEAGGKDMVLPDMEGMADLRRDLYAGAKAIMAGGDPIDYESKQKGVKGLMTSITGTTSPKYGYFHDKILRKKQDFSGRAVIYAAPDVGFNEAKFPKEQLWEMYKMHIIRDLSQKGYDLAAAKKAYEERNAAATASFNKMVDEVPLILNRAPTLMRTNIMALKPIPVAGKTIGLNILHLPGYAADYDGDAMSAFVPMSPEAIKEAKEKLLPEHHLHDARKGFGNPMFAPGHEAILGSVHLTKPDHEKAVVEFASEDEAMKALERGEIDDNTPIKIKG